MRAVFITLVAVLLYAGVTAPQARGASVYGDVRAAFEAANVLYRAHKYDSAAAAYRDVAARAVALNQDSIWDVLRDAHYNAACCYTLLGDLNTAFVLLDSAVARGFWDENFITSDPDLRAFRGIPLFDSLRAFIRARKARTAELARTAPTPVQLPGDTTKVRTAPLLVALHDDKGFPTRAIEYWQKAADSLGWIVVAPYGTIVTSSRELSFGLNPDSADKYVMNAVNRAVNALGGRPRKIYIAGTGLGAAMALQLGMKHPDVYSGIVSMNGYYNASYCDKFIAEVRRSGQCVLAAYDAASSSITASTLRAGEKLTAASVNISTRQIARAETAPALRDLISALTWLIDE